MHEFPFINKLDKLQRNASRMRNAESETARTIREQDIFIFLEDLVAHLCL